MWELGFTAKGQSGCMDGWTDGRIDGWRGSDSMADMLEHRQTFWERCHIEGDRRKTGVVGGQRQAMPAVERLGRASPSLSVWLGGCSARGNQETSSSDDGGGGVCGGTGRLRALHQL